MCGDSALGDYFDGVRECSYQAEQGGSGETDKPQDQCSRPGAIESGPDAGGPPEHKRRSRRSLVVTAQSGGCLTMSGMPR